MRIPTMRPPHFLVQQLISLMVDRGARERERPMVSPLGTPPDRAAAIATAQSSLAELRAVLGMPNLQSGLNEPTRKP